MSTEYVFLWDSVGTSVDANGSNLITWLLWQTWPRCCDRWGRFLADPRFIRSRLAPLRDDLTTEMVSEALDYYAARGMVRLYTSNGARYGYIPSGVWEKRQPWARKYRARPSNFPAPGPDFEDALRHVTELEALQSKCDSDSELNHQRTDSDSELNPLRIDTDSHIGVGIGMGIGIGGGIGIGMGVGDGTAPTPPSKNLLLRAEQYRGNCLGDADRRLLVRFLSEGYPEEWILEAIDRAELAGKRRLDYVGGILRGLRDEGGPHQKRRSQPPTRRPERENFTNELIQPVEPYDPSNDPPPAWENW